MGDISIAVNVEGFQALVDKLGMLAAQEALVTPLRQAQELIKDRLAQYPPPPSNSTYVRTGDLGRGWDAPVPTGLLASVVNQVSYAPLVQGSPLLGDPHQTDQHAATGWETELHAAEELVPQIEELFAVAIQEAMAT